MPDSLSARFPGYLAIDPGKDSGTVHWLRPPDDTVRVWPIIYQGRWTRSSGDSLKVQFAYFIRIVLDIAENADSLQGTATWYSDMITAAPPPHASVIAVRTACP